MLETFGGFLWGLLTQSQVISHITRRILESSGPAVVVVVNTVPGCALPESDHSFLLGDYCLSPTPERFILLGDPAPGSVFLGALIDGESPKVSWSPIAVGDEVILLRSNLAVGLVFGRFSGPSGQERMELARIRDFGLVSGCRVLEVACDDGCEFGLADS